MSLDTLANWIGATELFLRRLYRAIRMCFGSSLTRRTCWRLAKTVSPYRLVARDGFIYIEPRAIK